MPDKRKKGTLPKAYLRISPDLDQHEDPEVMVLLICAANRQAPRGRFKSRAVIERVIGKKRFLRCVVRGDLIQMAGDAWYLDGWDVWQEGDLTVGERMTRLRAKHEQSSHRRDGVTEQLRPSDGSVTSRTSHDRIAPSEASGVRRQASGEGTTVATQPLETAPAHAQEPPVPEGETQVERVARLERETTDPVVRESLRRKRLRLEAAS